MSLFAQSHSARSPHRRRAARWLALGDSYTVGEGVATHESWPVRLAALLAEAGDAVEPPRIVATTGWTAGELLTGMEAAGVWPAREHYDIVSLLIGVNDQYRGRPDDGGRTTQMQPTRLPPQRRANQSSRRRGRLRQHSGRVRFSRGYQRGGKLAASPTGVNEIFTYGAPSFAL